MTGENWNEDAYSEEMRRIQEEIEKVVSEEQVRERAEDLFDEVIDENGFSDEADYPGEETGEESEEEFDEEFDEDEDEFFEDEEEPGRGDGPFEKKPIFTKKRVLIGVIIVLVLAIAVMVPLFLKYRQKVAFYEDHFFSGTYINGVDFSDQTPDEVEKELISRSDDYELKI